MKSYQFQQKDSEETPMSDTFQDQHEEHDQDHLNQIEQENKGEFNTNKVYQTNSMVKYNEIFVFGSNKYGQIGLSEKNAGKNFCIPRFCHFNIVFTSVSCGAHHSVLLTQDGYAYTVGSNIYGQLGVDTDHVNYSYTPTLIQKLQDYNIIKVVSGAYHNLALTSDKQLFSWGRNNEGQLGLGISQGQSSSQNPSPQLVLTDKKVINVFSGWNHSFFITKQNEIYSFGSSLYGQLGQGKCESSFKPEKVLYEEKDQKIIKIACGETHSLFLNDQGQVFACGENQRGQLGLGRNKKVVLIPQYLSNENLFGSESIVDIACSRFSVAVTQKSQSVYAWGQVCDTDSNPIYIPQCVIKFSQDENKSDNQKKKENLKRNEVRKIAVSGDSCIVLMKDGDMYSWGKNQFGECGQGDFENKSDTFYPINFLKGKRILTFHMGEGHSIVLGREVYSRDPSKHYSNDMLSQQNSSHCVSNQEITLLEKSQSFICSDYNDNNECSSPSLHSSSQCISQNNASQHHDNINENQQQPQNHSRQQSFQYNQSINSEKDSFNQISIQKFQFMQSKTPNFLNESSSQQSQQYNSRSMHSSNQREKLSVVCREIERTHSPQESSTRNSNINNHFNFVNQALSQKQFAQVIPANNNIYKNKQEMEQIKSPKNQLQIPISNPSIQNSQQENIGQSYNQSNYEREQSNSEENLDSQNLNSLNQNNQQFNFINSMNEAKQNTIKKFTYFVSDKAPSYLEHEIQKNELIQQNDNKQSQQDQINQQQQLQTKLRSLTPQPNTIYPQNYETFSHVIGDQFMNFSQLANNNQTSINSYNPNFNQLSNWSNASTNISTLTQQRKQEKNSEFPRQMKQIQIESGQIENCNQQRINRHFVNNSEKSIDILSCSTQNPLVLHSQEFQMSENNLLNEDTSNSHIRNTSTLFGQKINLDFEREQQQQQQQRNSSLGQFTYNNLNEKLNQMNNAFQGLIKKLAIENNEINDQILKSISSTSTSKQLEEKSNGFTSSGKILITNPSDASINVGMTDNQNYFTLDTNSYTINHNSAAQATNFTQNQLTYQGSQPNFSKEHLTENQSEQFQSSYFHQQEQQEIKMRNNLMHKQFEEQQKTIEEYLRSMQLQQQLQIEESQMEEQNEDDNQMMMLQNKEMIDIEIQRQSFQLQEILQHQNNSILQSINKFKIDYQEQQNDINVQNKIKKLEALLATTAAFQQDQPQLLKISGEEKENKSPQMIKQLNFSQNSTNLLQSLSSPSLQSKVNQNDQKFDQHIQNLSVQLSQKDRDVADLQLALANKEIQISSLELKCNIKQIQNEQLTQTLEKALGIIENFQLFSNNFAKLR